jgi:hypothetical protein
MKAVKSNPATSSRTADPVAKRRSEGHVTQTTGQGVTEPKDNRQNEEQEDIDDEEFGPTLPRSAFNHHRAKSSTRSGPSIPNFDDLRHARELAVEDAVASREHALRDHRADRKSEQSIRRSHLDEIAPRAEPGTRERQLEKRRELAASNRAFASTKTDPTDVELPEADVMGDEQSLGELKRLKEMEERKRTEREIRREEVLRAKRAERELRMKVMKEKEEKTMEMLREIARARFGGAGAGAGGVEEERGRG